MTQPLKLAFKSEIFLFLKQRLIESKLTSLPIRDYKNLLNFIDEPLSSPSKSRKLETGFNVESGDVASSSPS